MTWKEKLQTLTSKWHPERDELSTVATTGDYNDLINVPQGGGGGSSEEKPIIIKVDQGELNTRLNNILSESDISQQYSQIIEQVGASQESIMGEFDEDIGEKFLQYMMSVIYNIAWETHQKNVLDFSNLKLWSRTASSNVSHEALPYKILSSFDSNSYKTTIFLFFKNDLFKGTSDDDKIIAYTLYENSMINNRHDIIPFNSTNLVETEEGYVYDVDFERQNPSQTEI